MIVPYPCSHKVTSTSRIEPKSLIKLSNLVDSDKIPELRSLGACQVSTSVDHEEM